MAATCIGFSSFSNRRQPRWRQPCAMKVSRKSCSVPYPWYPCPCGIPGHECRQRSALPSPDLLINGIGHVRDQRRRDFDPVQLLQLGLDLGVDNPRAYSAGTLIIEAIKPALPLSHQLRLKAPFPVPRHLDFELPCIALDDFLGLAISAVAGAPSLRGIGLVPKVVAHFHLKSPFDHPLGQLLQQAMLAQNAFIFMPSSFCVQNKGTLQTSSRPHKKKKHYEITPHRRQ